MKSIIVALALLVCCTTLKAQYTPAWGFQVASRKYATITDMAADSSGNIIVCGNLTQMRSSKPDTVVFQNALHEVPPLKSEAFLAKFRQNGELIWTRFIQGRIEFHRLAISPQGHIYVGGHFDDTLEFDDVYLKTICLYDAFLARVDSNGYFEWGERFGGLVDEFVTDVGCDKSGNAYIVGAFRDSLSCSIGTLHSIAAQGDFFLARLDEYGTIDWIEDMNNNDLATCTALDVDPSGNVLIGGRLDEKAYVLKLNSASNVLYFREYGLENNMLIADVIANPDNSFTMLLNVYDTANIGATKIFVPSGYSVAGIVTITPSGAVRSVILPTLTQPVEMVGASLSRRNGMLNVIGELRGKLEYGSSVIDSRDSSCSWILQLDASDVPSWAHSLAHTTGFTNRTSSRILSHQNKDLFASATYRRPFYDGDVFIGPPTQFEQYLMKFNGNGFMISYKKEPLRVYRHNEKTSAVRHTVRTNTLAFELIENVPARVTVHNMLGTAIGYLELNEANREGTVQCLSSGVYIARIESKGEFTTQVIGVAK